MADQPTLHVKKASEEHIEPESKSDDHEVVERGYDPKLFIDPSAIEKLLCFLCKWVAREAVDLSCPEHEEDEEEDDSYIVFCKGCLERFIESSQTCPIGKHENPTFERSGYARKRVMNAKVRCSRAVEQTKTAFTSIPNSSNM